MFQQKVNSPIFQCWLLPISISTKYWSFLAHRSCNWRQDRCRSPACWYTLYITLRSKQCHSALDLKVTGDFSSGVIHNKYYILVLYAFCTKLLQFPFLLNQGAFFHCHSPKCKNKQTRHSMHPFQNKSVYRKVLLCRQYKE